MACFGMPPELSMTVAVLKAGIEIWLASRELEVYKDQRETFDLLTDVNIERGEKLHGFDHQVKALHSGVYGAINSLETFDGCCEDAARVIPSIVARQMFDYVDALDEMSGYQAGLKQALYGRVVRVAGKAVAQQANVFHRDQLLEWNTIASKQSAIAGSVSPHNPHNIMSGVMADLAENAADRLNTASTLFSGFTREAFRDLGFAAALASGQDQNTIDANGFFTTTPAGSTNAFEGTQTPLSFPSATTPTSTIGNSTIF